MSPWCGEGLVLSVACSPTGGKEASTSAVSLLLCCNGPSRTVLATGSSTSSSSRPHNSEKSIHQRSMSSMSGLEELLSCGGEASRWSTSGTVLWRVRTLPGYPGVQYRRSKSMADRHRRYAPSGTIVRGCEEDGIWLRLGKHVYLPLAVDGHSVVERVSAADQERDLSGNFFQAPRSASCNEAAATDISSPTFVSASTFSVTKSAGTIGVLGSAGAADASKVPLMANVDLWDTVLPPSPSAGLPAPLPPAAAELPARAPTGDSAADAAERLLARVVDPFGTLD